MRMEVLTDPSAVPKAWSRQYDRMASIFAKILARKRGKVAEVGCGAGQLTIPLAKRIVDVDFVLVDRFADTKTGSYSRSHRALISNLKKAKLKRRFRIVVSDYAKWITLQDEGAYDAVISSEFLPEIDSLELRWFMNECYRLLRPGGVTVHSFLSPIPRNSRQKLVITADSNPLWTRTPPKEWFSPRPELVVKEMRKVGFQRIRRIIARSCLILKGDAARSELGKWEVRESFYERHRKQLNQGGLEIPDWAIISGVKTS